MKIAKLKIGEKHKILAIVGPTASGKSDLAVLLALRLRSGQARKEYGIEGAEIVSADSRQVYRYMDIGTGKITAEEMRGVPHHLLDVANPTEQFSVAEYQGRATEAINDILSRGKLPILVGGSGLYIQAVVDGLILPEVAPNIDLRNTLRKSTNEELFSRLKKLDPNRATTIDPNNPRRLIRAIEIATALGSVPPVTVKKPYDTLLLGIRVEKEELEKRITKRFDAMLAHGLVAEIEALHNQHGVSWERIRSFGLECVWVADFLAGTISEQEMHDGAIRDTLAYAKRQMTWFKRMDSTSSPQVGSTGSTSSRQASSPQDSRIHWISEPNEAVGLVQKFLS